MDHNRVLSKVTVRDLKKYALDHDYDWKLEVLPNLESIAEFVELNTDKRVICSLALTQAIGTPLKRRQVVKEGKVVDDLYQP